MNGSPGPSIRAPGAPGHACTPKSGRPVCSATLFDLLDSVGASTAPVSERRESNVRSYCRSFPVMFARAKGAVVYVADGRPFRDLMAGAGALSLGYGSSD